MHHTACDDMTSPGQNGSLNKSVLFMTMNDIIHSEIVLAAVSEVLADWRSSRFVCSVRLARGDSNNRTTFLRALLLVSEGYCSKAFLEIISWRNKNGFWTNFQRQGDQDVRQAREGAPILSKEGILDYQRGSLASSSIRGTARVAQGSLHRLGLWKTASPHMGT